LERSFSDKGAAINLDIICQIGLSLVIILYNALFWWVKIEVERWTRSTV
jgi:hypothetical protein